jgi:colanic acid biosynthesis protein WcaH
VNSTPTTPSKTLTEPKPGEWIAANEFAEVIRLTPLVAIDLIVRSSEGKILVGRRVNEPAKGMLFVPGSRISKNETRSAAFKRITREELGTEAPIEQSRFVGVYEHLYPTNRFERPGFGTHYITLAHELKLTLDPSQLPTDQHGEYLWLSPDEILRSSEVHENTKAYFR